MRRSAIILGVSLTGAAGAALVAHLVLHASPEQTLYSTPVLAPFLAFGLERFAASPPRSPRGFLLDASVTSLAALRVVAPPLPYASGHALFTAYAAATASGPVTRTLALVVLAQTLFTKLVLWHDWRTPLAAVVLAAGAIALDLRLGAPASARTPPPA